MSPAGAQTPTPISYKSVQQAYDAMRANEQAKASRDEDGWITVVIRTGPDEGIWTFTPRGYPAFPAVVKRQVIERDGNLFVAMDMVCQSRRDACDALLEEFNKLNQQMAQDLNKKR
jgi:hypothetical protein